MKDKDDGNMNMFFFLFMLPLLIISVVALLLAAVARRAGAPPIVVSCLTFPTAFLVGNCLAGGVMICGSFMVTLIMGDPAAFTWYLKNSLDLSGFFAWGPFWRDELSTCHRHTIGSALPIRCLHADWPLCPPYSKRAGLIQVAISIATPAGAGFQRAATK
jgi:hypothetical protein